MKNGIRPGRLIALPVLLAATTPLFGSTRTDPFDTDPLWEGRFNRNVPNPAPTVTQAFGFSPSSIAGGAAGELGGTIQRTTRPAWYADEISTRSFNDVLTASGKLSMPGQSSGGGLHFGWFNSERQGWRPWSAIGFRLNGEGGQSRVLLDYMTQTWKAGGLSAPSINPGYYIPHDGSDHTWEMTYDPNGNAGGGSLSFRLDNLTPVSFNLDPGHKLEGGSFDRFGLWNQQTPSGGMTAYFDDVIDNGVTQNFNSASTGWEANGNNVSFQDPEQRGAHNFGFSNTNHAGGANSGEIGGLIWRPGPHAEPYYAAPLDQDLTLEMPLVASGKVSLVRGATDGGAYFGWFNEQSIKNVVETQPQIAPVANFLAVQIEGPTRIGHYFRPVFATSDAERRDAQEGPIIMPNGEPHDFSILYNPSANNGIGSIIVRLDDQTRVFNLTASDRAEGALFDRFGIFNISPDGHFVEMYLDDLTYSAAVPQPQWVFDGTGSWNTTTNWFGGVPNGVDAVATFGSFITAPRLVHAHEQVMAGTLNFDAADTYLLTGLGSVRLEVSSGSASINVVRGSHKVNLPLTIASDTTIEVAGGAALKISDPVTVNAQRTVTQIGEGSVEYESTVSLGVGATMQLATAAGGEVALKIGQLNLAANAKLDLANGGVVISEQSFSDVEAMVMRGLNGGDWQGDGITSSAAAATGYSTVGLASNFELGYENFSGFSALDGREILVRHTWFGDADLSGKVELVDFDRFLSGFNAGEIAGWINGDFDYSGAVDLGDFDLLLEGLRHQLGPRLTPELYAALSGFADAHGLEVDFTSIPEPSATWLVAIAFWAPLRRRRGGQS